MKRQNKIIILEIENSILLASKKILPDWEEPLLSITTSANKKLKFKEKGTYYVYMRKFGLEFLDFLCKNYDTVLYTNLERELATAITDAFCKLKPNIEFKIMIWGKPFWKSIYKQPRPVKWLDNIIPLEHKEKFLILDSESISYLEKYEDIFIPLIPIASSEKHINAGVTKTSWDNKSKEHKLNKKNSSLRLAGSVEVFDDIQSSLSNHWLFYLKQLLTQSIMPNYTNLDLLKSVTISYLGQE